MNKTLLLIICDFLLLNLLALTRWERPPQPDVPANQQPTPQQTVNQVVQEDLVGALRATLEEERDARSTLGEELEAAHAELNQRQESLAEREQRLAAVQQSLQEKERQAAQLSERVADAQASVSQLSDRLTQAAQQAATSRTQAEQLARELAQRQEAEARLQGQLRQLEEERTKAQEQIQTLNTQVQVAETERGFLRESVDTLRTQVSSEREERARLQEHTGKLAEGVTQLAERSADLREEIRSNTPINANTLYNDFLANRVNASFHAVRDGFFGQTTADIPETQTIFISDGTNVYALFHTRDAITREGAANWRAIEGRLSRGGQQAAIERLQYLVIDPRIVVAPVDAATAASFGARVYPTALQPFKFPEAVIISQGGKFYGEVEFKLDAQTPGYVKMQSSIFNALFGRFAPSAGDLVFSKTGELLGIMVTSDYCALVDHFAISKELPFGTNLIDQHTGDIIASQRDRILRLPVRLQ